MLTQDLNNDPAHMHFCQCDLCMYTESLLKSCISLPTTDLIEDSV